MLKFGRHHASSLYIDHHYHHCPQRDCPLHHAEQQQAALRACLPASGQRQRVQHRHINICQAHVRHTLWVTN